MDYSIWGSILGSPYLGNYHIESSDALPSSSMAPKEPTIGAFHT